MEWRYTKYKGLYTLEKEENQCVSEFFKLPQLSLQWQLR